MVSRLVEGVVGVLICVGLAVYLAGHCSHLDREGGISGVAPSALVLQSGQSVWMLPGTAHLARNGRPFDYFTHLYVTTFHPLVVCGVGYFALVMLTSFPTQDRRPLFVVTNQLAAVAAFGVAAEASFFLYTYRDTNHGGNMLALLAIAFAFFMAAMCLSFYLVSRSFAATENGPREL